MDNVLNVSLYILCHVLQMVISMKLIFLN